MRVEARAQVTHVIPCVATSVVCISAYMHAYLMRSGVLACLADSLSGVCLACLVAVLCLLACVMSVCVCVCRCSIDVVVLHLHGLRLVRRGNYHWQSVTIRATAYGF